MSGPILNSDRSKLFNNWACHIPMPSNCLGNLKCIVWMGVVDITHYWRGDNPTAIVPLLPHPHPTPLHSYTTNKSNSQQPLTLEVPRDFARSRRTFVMTSFVLENKHVPLSSRYCTSRGPLYYYWLTLMPAWKSNYIHCKMRDEIVYPFQNFNEATG